LSQAKATGSFRLIGSRAVGSWAGETTRCQNGGAAAGQQGSFHSQGLFRPWREFLSFATDLSQPGCPATPALVELFLVWLGLEGRGPQAKAALGAISWEQTLQGQSDPTKDKRLRLVLDGIERAWAKAKDKVLVRDPFPVAAKAKDKVLVRDPFPVAAHVEMAQTCRSELWIRDAFLVDLGLGTMR